MGKVKKVLIGLLVTALAAGAVWGGLAQVKKGSQKEVLVASVESLAQESYSNADTLSGNIVTTATQSITVDNDMIIQEVYVSEGDDVDVGDPLVSFDMTLVEMELNIARLKHQKLEQDLAKAKKRLTSLRNGGAVQEDDIYDQGIDSSLSGTDTDADIDAGQDDEMASISATAGDHYLAAIMQPLLLAAITDGFGDAEQTQETQAADPQTADSQAADFAEAGEDSAWDGLGETDYEEGAEGMDESGGDPGSAPGYYDTPTEDGDFGDGDDSSEQNGFQSDGSDPLTPEPTPTPVLPDGVDYFDPYGTQGDSGFTDGEEPFYELLDYDTEPYQGSGTEEDPFLFLCSSFKGKVNVTGAFLNKMAGYNADGTTVIQPGGYWYLLEFHQNDVIGDYEDRKASCIGYYLIEGSMLSNPVDRFAQMDFTLEGAMQYDTGEDDLPEDPTIPDGSSTLSRSEAIRIQEKRIASLELDIKESDLNITKLEKKVSRQMIYSRLDGTVATVGDPVTGENSESDSFMVIKSKDGFYVQGTVGELMLDRVEPGTVLNCVCWGEEYVAFDAEVIEVSEYPVDSNSYYYDTNPNVSSYVFTARIPDDSVKVSFGDWVDISLPDSSGDSEGIVLSKAFVRTVDGISYVYKEDNGVLKKQIVTVSDVVNDGYAVVVTAGITMEDKIAFPYSKSIEEGMKTKEGSLDEFMGYDQQGGVG